MSHLAWLGRGARALQALRASPGTFSVTSSSARFASAARDEALASQPSTSGQDELADSKQLTAASVGRYYQLNPAFLPEANRDYAGAFYAPRDPGHERRGGCKALQQEVEATGRHALLYRPALHALYEAVGGGEARGPHRVLLSGPAGAGKSIALAGLVEWARQRGWLVLYIPSCLALVRGGYFSQRPGAPGCWDTLTSAQQVLKGVLDAHGPALKQMPLLSEQEVEARFRAARKAEEAAVAAAAGQPEGVEEEMVEAEEEEVAPAGAGLGFDEEAEERTLYDVVTAGIAQDEDAQQAVDTVLQLVRQLAAAAAEEGEIQQQGQGQQGAPRVLFALDDYNYLYGVTDYGAHPGLTGPGAAEDGGGSGGARRAASSRRRRVLHSDELVLASGMRLLDSEGLGGAARVVAATTTSPALPVPPSLPLAGAYTELTIPGFSEDETRNALAHYFRSKHTSVLATSRQARQLFALTRGNARELRLHAPSLGIPLK